MKESPVLETSPFQHLGEDAVQFAIAFILRVANSDDFISRFGSPDNHKITLKVWLDRLERGLK